WFSTIFCASFGSKSTRSRSDEDGSSAWRSCPRARSDASSLASSARARFQIGGVADRRPEIFRRTEPEELELGKQLPGVDGEVGARKPGAHAGNEVVDVLEGARAVPEASVRRREQLADNRISGSREMTEAH